MYFFVIISPWKRVFLFNWTNLNGLHQGSQVKIGPMFLQKKIFCLFWGVLVSLENFSLIWRCHHYRKRAADFDLCSAFMAIERWGIFSVPHLLWHGASVYKGHPRGPVKLTSVAERLVVELSVAVLTTVFKT